MTTLGSLHLAVLRTDVDVPYPLRLRAARWCAHHVGVALRDCLFTRLADQDRIELLAELDGASWALASALSGEDVGADVAATILAGYPQVPPRRTAAEASRSVAVLEILSVDPRPQVAAAVAANPHASVTARVRALTAVETALIERGRSTPLLSLLTEAAVDGDVLTRVAPNVRTVELAYIVSARPLPAADAARLVRDVLAAPIADSSDAAHPKALVAAVRLAGHADPTVHDALRDALAGSEGNVLPAPLRALLTPREGGLSIDDVVDRLNDDISPGADVLAGLAGLDETAWTCLERVIPDFTGTVADLLAVVTAIGEPPSPRRS